MTTIALLLVLAAPTAAQSRHFEARVRPLLVKHCIDCHGPKKQKGGLRLDSAAAVQEGEVIDAKAPEKSLLLKAIRHEGKLKMPPEKKLPAADIAVLTAWVKAGAPWPVTSTTRRPGEITPAERAFWAFQRVNAAAVPMVKDRRWGSNPVDAFILARLEAKNLTPASRADRRTIIRRVTFDLTGLPPTPDEVEAFVKDTRPGAYERVVDRLLASPAYGERWGRHWLDVVRYADTAGDNSDYPIPQAWKFRNWVIDAFNADTPYDRLIKEQVAGDLLKDRTRESLIATGYLASARRFGSYEDKRYQWYLTFEDTIENLGRTFLGLGLSCARCHDHKFDPVSSEDYYALYGFFQSTRYPWPGTELAKKPYDLVPLGSANEISTFNKERQKQLADLDSRIKSEKNKNKQNALRKERDRVANSPLPFELAYAVSEGKRWVGSAKLQKQGDPTKPGKEVPRRFLRILGGQVLPKEEKGSGRLHLANWIADPKNPLTARVMVNRLWHYHFGQGLVATPNDFGKQGQRPSHPELLDWLAARFSAEGWSIKSMHRLMVLSRAYQQGSEDSESNLLADPDNRLLWRFNRRRLDAEAIRDTLLSISGELDRTPGREHPFPAPSSWSFTQHKPFKAVYPTDRRSVYLMTQRIQRHPYLALFDGPDTNASTAKRGTSTTPLQALFLMNDPWIHRLSVAFGNRLLREGTTEKDRLIRSFLLAYGRHPGKEELATAALFLNRIRSKVKSAAKPNEVEARTWESYARALFLTSELVYVD